MLLTLHGRISPDPTSCPSIDTFERLAGAISQWVAENVPYYIPSQSEVQEIIERKASFAIQHVRPFTESIISNQFGEQVLDKIYDGYAHILASDWGAIDGAEIVIIVLQKM